MIVCRTPSTIRPLLGYHLNCVTGTLFKTYCAAGAFLIFKPIEQTWPKLCDGILGTGRVAIVAFEAVAAGITALGLVTRFVFVESGDDFRESSQSFGGRERAWGIRFRIAIDWQMKHTKIHHR